MMMPVAKLMAIVLLHFQVGSGGDVGMVQATVLVLLPVLLVCLGLLLFMTVKAQSPLEKRE